MELRIANWITHVVCGSVVAPVVAIALILFGVELFNGKFLELMNLGTFKWLICGLLYAVSMSLVSSLEGKDRRRRLASWSFSIVFHLSLLAYMAFGLDGGTGVFVIGMAETIIAVLSVVGLAFCIWSGRRGHA